MESNYLDDDRFDANKKSHVPAGKIETKREIFCPQVCVAEHPGVDLPVELVVTGVASTAPATSDLELLNFDHHLGNQPTCARVTS